MLKPKFSLLFIFIILQTAFIDLLELSVSEIELGGVVGTEHSENCRRSEIGYEYDGVIHTTKSGIECQRWDSMQPHQHNYSYLAAHENFCRNMYGERMLPWCYTTDRGVEWEFCDIPMCVTKPRECALTAVAYDYFGNVSKTTNGKPCQGWDTYKPHFHQYGVIGEQRNFCRNPTLSQGSWCYTQDPTEETAYCNVPLCDYDDVCFKFPCRNGGTCIPNGDSYSCVCFDMYTGQHCEEQVVDNLEECLMTKSGWEYKGTRNKTKSGSACVVWRDTEYKDYFRDQENYCRHFQDNGVPKCIITGGYLEDCDIPVCKTPHDDCLQTKQGERYFGTANMDKDGNMCKRWDSEESVEYGYEYLRFEENYCRNPNSGAKPWCFTEFGWNFCNIPECKRSI